MQLSINIGEEVRSQNNLLKDMVSNFCDKCVKYLSALCFRCDRVVENVNKIGQFDTTKCQYKVSKLIMDNLYQN